MGHDSIFLKGLCNSPFSDIKGKAKRTVEPLRFFYYLNNRETMFLKFGFSLPAEKRQAGSELAFISSRTFADAHALSCLTFFTSAGHAGVHYSLVFTLGACRVAALSSCWKWYPLVRTMEFKVLIAGQSSIRLLVKLPWKFSSSVRCWIFRGSWAQLWPG